MTAEEYYRKRDNQIDDQGMPRSVTELMEAYAAHKSAEDNKELVYHLGVMMRSMLAHPDCVEGSEFDDMTSIADELIQNHKS